MTALDPFYLIVGSADEVAELVPYGVRLVQLRIKEQSLDDVFRQLRIAKAVCERHGCTLVVNDYWQVAIELRCEWVHLGQGDLDHADIAAIRAVGIRIGVSTHDHAELARALEVDADYVALGPVYPTKLKVMPWAPQGVERIIEWRNRIGDRSLVAIGGLTPERAQTVLAAGADAAAVVTDVCTATDPRARTQAWVEATR